MSQPTSAVPAESKRHADAETPLIRNCWYVAGFSHEFDQSLQDRWLLSQNVLLYRSGDGAMVALQNRCPHRGFPLSKGCRDGDLVVCGYHGLSFDPDGRCVRAPMLRAAPAHVRVQSYPVVERSPLVWIWMGDRERADEALIPAHDTLNDPHWAVVSDSYEVNANYVHMHENLLDLTHFSFLHAGNIGTPDYVASPFEVSTLGEQVRIVRRLEGSPAPKIYSVPMKLGERKVLRVSDSWYVSPAFHVAHARIEDLEAGPGERCKYRVDIMHMMTPAAQTSFHYFFALSRDFGLDEPAAGEWMKDGALKGFFEDKEALEWIRGIADRESRDYRELSFASDRAGLEMRRIIQRLADAEAHQP